MKTFRVQPNFNLDIVSEQLDSIRQLAREGGPDLTDLRSYPGPDEFEMESGEPSQSSRRTKQPGTKNKTKTTEPYDKNFEYILQASGIYFYPYTKEPRPSVTSVTIPSSVYESFKTTVLRAKKESEVVKYLFPILEDGIRVENQEFQDTTFSNLEQFTDANIEQRALVKGTPDRCYGSPFQRLCEEFREDLNSKGHDASVLDGKAHTIACTFVNKSLKFYAIHAARSSDIDGRIEYFMHGIEGFFMDLSISKFINAIAAYQNLQDYAEGKRNEAIELANTRAWGIREAS
ncbi:hypothetical protein EPUL_003378 [Erysiphe pulchra]|uniref:Uncharacterized protein n=1 Tax=Erysiphe pulchra TaxID=225359 RepID=A0A2S4PQC2_9PEZI|nr:hypothetical protein EPUL_003378 [Erysiphe pulchra]